MSGPLEIRGRVVQMPDDRVDQVGGRDHPHRRPLPLELSHQLPNPGHEGSRLDLVQLRTPTPLTDRAGRGQLRRMLPVPEPSAVRAR